MSKGTRDGHRLEELRNILLKQERKKSTREWEAVCAVAFFLGGISYAAIHYWFFGS